MSSLLPVLRSTPHSMIGPYYVSEAAPIFNQEPVTPLLNANMYSHEPFFFEDCLGKGNENMHFPHDMRSLPEYSREDGPYTFLQHHNFPPFPVFRNPTTDLYPLPSILMEPKTPISEGLSPVRVLDLAVEATYSPSTTSSTESLPPGFPMESFDNPDIVLSSREELDGLESYLPEATERPLNPLKLVFDNMSDVFDDLEEGPRLSSEESLTDSLSDGCLLDSLHSRSNFQSVKHKRKFHEICETDNIFVDLIDPANRGCTLDYALEGEVHRSLQQGEGHQSLQQNYVNGPWIATTSSSFTEKFADLLGQNVSIQSQTVRTTEVSRDSVVTEKFADLHGKNGSIQAQADRVTETSRDERNYMLLNSLLISADYVAERNFSEAVEHVRELHKYSCSLKLHHGNSSERVLYYFSDSLMGLINNETGDHFFTCVHTRKQTPEYHLNRPWSILSSKEQSELALTCFYRALPFADFEHFTVTQSILDVLRPHEKNIKIHVVDLDISQGMQWASLIGSLTSLEGSGSVHALKITGVGPDLESLNKTGKRLIEFASEHGLMLEYRAVEQNSLESLDAQVLNVLPGECVAVNCPSILSKYTGTHSTDFIAMGGVLRMIKGLEPSVVTVTQKEYNSSANEGKPHFKNRFVDTLRHYSILFDCLETTMSRSSEDRMCIEMCHLAPEINRVIAEGGIEISHPARAQVRDVFDDRVRAAGGISDTWQMLFRRAGFRTLPFSSFNLKQAENFLSAQNISERYTVKNDGAALSLGWDGNAILAVSTWIPSPTQLTSWS